MLPSLYAPGIFRGMSYEDASRKGLEIVQRASQRQDWCRHLDALIELREVMRTTAPHPC